MLAICGVAQIVGEALGAGWIALATYIRIALRAFIFPAIATEIGIGAVFTARWHTIAIGIAPGALLAGGRALIAEILEPLRAVIWRRHTACWVVDVAGVALGANGHADETIVIGPVTARNAGTRLRIALIAVGAGALIVALAKAILGKIGALRAVWRAFASFQGISHAVRAIIEVGDAVRQAFLSIAQAAMKALRAVGKGNGLIAFRAAMAAGRHAVAGKTWITQIANRTFRQAIIVIDGVARWAARSRLATAAGVAAARGATAGTTFNLAGLSVHGLQPLQHLALLGVRWGWQQQGCDDEKTRDQQAAGHDEENLLALLGVGHRGVSPIGSTHTYKPTYKRARPAQYCSRQTPFASVTSHF